MITFQRVQKKKTICPASKHYLLRETAVLHLLAFLMISLLPSNKKDAARLPARDRVEQKQSEINIESKNARSYIGSGIFVFGVTAFT